MTKPIETPQEMATIVEAQVRAMRDRVFGTTISDKSWWGCRDHWMSGDSIRWLQARKENKVCTP